MAGMENIFSYMIFGGMLLSGGQYKLTGREFIFITEMQICDFVGVGGHITSGLIHKSGGMKV